MSSDAKFDAHHSGNESNGELLASIFEKHRPWLVKAIRNRMDPRLAQRVDAEDVVSQIFMIAKRKW